MAYYAVLLVPAHADSGVKPFARYNTDGILERRTWYCPPQPFTAAIYWYPPMQT